MVPLALCKKCSLRIRIPHLRHPAQLFVNHFPLRPEAHPVEQFASCIVRVNNSIDLCSQQIFTGCISKRKRYV